MYIKQKVGSPSDLSNEGVSIFLNPFTYLKIRNNRKLLSECDTIYIDGQWLVYFLSWFKIVNIKRCSFDNTSAAPIVLSDANLNKSTLVFIGSTQEAAEGFKAYLTKNYPNIKIPYYRNGYFNSELEWQNEIDRIQISKPNLVIVGMGFLKQEAFAIAVSQKGFKGKIFTCGGFIHQTASKGHKYYPSWVDKYNLRFAYRIWDEPKLIRRYTLDYSLFVCYFLIDIIKVKLKSG
jgi:N-acetylglucosaminyldiphosphoundecaprenol N-acetyl-beta-D-mannosaminyltransferase